MNSLYSILMAGLLVGVSSLANAGVVAYSGLANETLFIEDAPKMGKDVFILKFSGIESKWAEQAIKTVKTVTSKGDRYAFDYDVELSDGVQKKTYQIVVGIGQTLVDGSLVPKVELHFQESGKPVVLNYDTNLTKASQKLGLPAEYKKSLFKPVVD